MRKSAILAAFLALCPAPLLAQDWNQLAMYSAYISPADMHNSKGAALTSLGAALQQDRANFHRFGRRDARDEGDPLFADRALRARIPQMVRAGGDDRGRFAQMVRRGEPFGVTVFVCGNGNLPSTIFLAGWDEDHSGCY